MSAIRVLSEETIDKIAAGEVVERPASIVKELVENAIDAGATAITVEIKDGGISFIRITDNGCGIPREEIPTAFLRHATSKITDASDLDTVMSLGFRGEALSSIAAIAQVELITKTNDNLIGTRYVIEGAKEIEIGDIGVPNGTTIIVRNIFFNTPVRRKFLKSAITESSYVAEVCEHLALSRPDISIKYIQGGQVKFHTSGSGDLKELIYRIYGREVAGEVIPISYDGHHMKINGYLGKPILNRSTRNYENYFINGRYVKSKIIATAAEEGYREYLMQHKFPFFIINIELDTSMVDVNVHPTKMDVRFSDNDFISSHISSAISSTLKVKEMIPDTLLVEPEPPKEEVLIEEKANKQAAPEPFEQIRSLIANNVINDSNNITLNPEHNVVKAKDTVIIERPVQMDLFEDKILTKDAMADYRIIGQVFDTFWLIQYQDKMLMMDQHAAHEKVKYEALIKKLRDNTVISQSINPPIVITLTPGEADILNRYLDNFTSIGFELEDFGGREIALRAVPMDLYGYDPKQLFMEILDELSQGSLRGVPEVVNDKLASMACKSAVKGNNSMTEAEVWALLSELMTLDNPYNCPHGRPTIITMSKYEMEKRFKRIV